MHLASWIRKNINKFEEKKNVLLVGNKAES